MKHENSEKILQEVQEPEQKEEKFKKIFIIVIVLLLFGVTYHYYAGINNPLQKKLSQKELNLSNNQNSIANVNSGSSSSNKITKFELLKPTVQRKKRLEQLEEIQKAENLDKNSEIKIAKTEEITPKKILNTKFKPTGKTDLLALSGKSSGKHDPFSYSESQFIPFAAEQSDASSISSGNLPPVPRGGNIGNLPPIPGLSGVNPLSSFGLNNPPAPKPEDLITIKGFIGNKVIIDINGTVEALNENEKISNIKVLNINSSELTAKFEINGKIYTKTMQSLSDENNPNIELVKNLHN